MKKKLTTSIRKKRLAANIPKLFWIKALMNIKVINIVLSLFYLHRHISLDQIFLLSVIWSLTNVIAEVPSSYIADKWGRKKTMIVGAILSLGQWIIFLFANSFAWFAASMVSYALGIAMLSGTDEALLYDTTKELGNEKKSLKALGKFHSAKHLIKIISPIVGVLLVADLTDLQFMLAIGVDVIATAVAVGLSFTLVEANHKMDVVDVEANIMTDAIAIIKSSRDMLHGMMGRVLVFISILMVWHYYQAFYTDLGVPLLLLGIGWAINHLIITTVQQRMPHTLTTDQIRIRLDGLHLICFALFFSLIIFWFTMPNPYLLYVLFLSISSVQSWRIPLHAELFNKIGKSFNRATTISLINFLKSFLDIPIMFVSSLLIVHSTIYPYILAFSLVAITVIFFPLSTLSIKERLQKRMI